MKLKFNKFTIDVKQNEIDIVIRILKEYSIFIEENYAVYFPLKPEIKMYDGDKELTVWLILLIFVLH